MTLHPGQGKPGVETTSGDPRVAQLRGEVSSMRQMVALSLLQQQSAGERLRGVSYAYQVPSSDTEVLSALLRHGESRIRTSTCGWRRWMRCRVRVESGHARGGNSVDSQAGPAAGADRADRPAGGSEGDRGRPELAEACGRRQGESKRRAAACQGRDGETSMRIASVGY